MKPGTKARIYPSLGENYNNPGILIKVRVILTVILLAVSSFVTLTEDISLAVLTAAALISGYDIAINAVKDVLKRVYLKENLLVTLAVLISFFIGRGAEGVIALLLLQLAYIIREYALHKIRDTICETIEPRKIRRGEADSESESENTKPNYSVGDVLVLFEGKSVPADCVITSGAASADLSFTTGDNTPIRVAKGDYLPAGSVCIDGQFRAEVVSNYENGVSRQMSYVLQAGYGEMTDTELAWAKISGFFVPLAFIVSIALIAVLPLAYKFSFTEAFRRAAAVIAVASPCGVLLSIPLTYFSGSAAARIMGIVFGHSRALEKSAAIKAVVFDKAGTLTEKNYLVTDIKTDKMDKATFLKVAAYAEAKSECHVAKAIVAAYGQEITDELVHDFVEHKGKGVSVTVDGIQIIMGKGEFLAENGVSIPEGIFEGANVHMSVNGVYAGRIVLNETTAKDAGKTVKALAAVGVERIAMVSGDGRERDRAVATELGIEEYYAECDMEEKAQRTAEIKTRIDSRSTLAFVEDCEYEEDLLEVADIGIVINGVSCRQDLPTTDVVIMANSTGPVASVIRIARRTNRSAVAGALIGCLVKLVIMTLAALGIAPLWFAMLIDFCASLGILLCCTTVHTQNRAEEIKE